jgi:hypothetical protein
VSAARWQSLGSSLSSPGVFTERIALFLATELVPAHAEREAAEVFDIHWIPLAEAVDRALAGEIEDAKTCIGLLRAWHALNLKDNTR